MKPFFPAIAVLVLATAAAHAENWVVAGQANIGEIGEETVLIDVDSIVHNRPYVRFRVRWMNVRPVLINAGWMMTALVVQEVDCRTRERFMLERDDFNPEGRLIRRWRAPGGVRSPTNNQPGAAGDVAARFVCGNSALTS